MKTVMKLALTLSVALLTACATPDYSSIDPATCTKSVLGKVSYGSKGELLHRYNCGNVVVYR